MMKVVVIFVLLLSCLSCKDKRVVDADNLYIENADWDFGDVHNDSMLFHAFKLQNPTCDTCVINHIITSCGCTSYQLSKDTLFPGEMSLLEVQLNPKGLTGNFIRDISVVTSLREEPYTMTLSACIPLTKEVVKRKYRTKICDNLYANTPNIYIGNVYKDKLVSGELEIVNTSDKNQSLKCMFPKKPYVQIVAPEILEPYKPENVTVIYDGSQIGESWGIDSTNIFLAFNDQKGKIECSAMIIPFPLEKSQKMPRMFIASKISYNKGLESKIEIQNIGNSDLHIMALRYSANIENIKYDSIIPPKTIGILFLRHKKLCDEEKIEMLTNDLTVPIMSLVIK